MNETLKSFLADQGIQHEIAISYTPEQNSISERINGTLIRLARTLLYACGISSRFWPEAIQHATYLYNRLPHSSLDFRSPLEVLDPVLVKNFNFNRVPEFG